MKGNLQTVSLKYQDIADIPHYPALEEALAKSSADAAVISLPTFLHESGTLAALKKEMHVFVEKPFALTAAECTNMLSLAAERQKQLAVGYVVRKIPEYAFLHETTASGRPGKLKFLQLNRITGVPDWGNWSDPATVSAVGGALFDLVSHDIDFARYLLGEPEKITVDPFVCREFNGNLELNGVVLDAPGYGAFRFDELLRSTIPDCDSVTHWRKDCLPWIHGGVDKHRLLRIEVHTGKISFE